MVRFSILFLFFLYFIPFTVVTTSQYIFEYIQIVIILFGFLLGLSFFQKGNLTAVDYSNYFVAKKNLIFLIFVLYFLMRFEYLYLIIENMVNGTYASWALSNAVQRYEGTVILSVSERLAGVLFFIYAILLGTISFAKRNILYHLFFVFMILVESSNLARAGVLIALTMYFVEFLFRRNLFYSNLSLVRYIFYSLISFCILLFVFLFSAYLRINTSDNVFEIIIQKAGSYTIASYQALFVFMQSQSWYFGTFGLNTFAGVFKVFGIETQQGFYLPTNTEFGSTNIYTNIRGLLEDFSYLGAFIIFVFLGAFIKYATYKRIGFIQYYALSLILVFYFYLLYSPFIFFNVVFAHFFGHLLLVFFHEK